MVPGRTLSHYEILEKIGSGGMGDVYLARDTELDRKVALKVLPLELGENPERRDRFKREAKALAALNHPNIVSVYSVEHADGVHFITMELVRGRTLSELLPDEGFSLDRFFEIAIPLADAIAAAHQHGITHRDLKPDNVMVSDDDGRLKVLDFGLAKELPGIREEGSELPTEVRTHEGTIVGTPHYMSPEQAEGKPVDARSDIFSLGIVLYEMATGERPFSGDSPVSVLSAILTKSPASITERNPALPAELGKIIQRCLNKDLERRYQTATDLRNAIEELKEEQPSRARPTPRARRARATFVTAVVLAAAAVSYWLARSDREGATADPIRPRFEQITSESGRELEPSLSPDGAFVVYARHSSGQWDIYQQRLGGQRAFNLTEDFAGDDTQPAFSPDGERIAFRSERDGGGIFLMGATGESVRRLTDFGYYPAWSPDGESLVFSGQQARHVRIAPTGGTPELWRVDVGTEKTRLLFEGQALQPSWSPGNHRIAFWAVDPQGARDIWTIDAEGGEARAVTDDPALDWNPVWSADGRYLFFSSERGGSINLWRVRVRETTGETLREPEPITAPTPFAAHLSVSSGGRRIAYAAIIESSDIYKIGFDPSSGSVVGDPVAVTRRSGFAVGSDPSPDGQRLTFMGFQSQWDIFVVGADGSGLRNLTDDPHNDRLPRWSPKGDRIAFFSTRSGSAEIWTIRADGARLEQLTDAPGEGFVYPAWSPDGSRLVYRGRTGVYVRELEAPGEAARRLESPKPAFERFSPHAWSPDGAFLAGELSSESGESGIVVYAMESGELISLTDFGWFPRWLSDSRRLVFSAGDSTASSLFLVDRQTGETREIYRPTDAAAEWVSISPDERTIYFTRSSTESDIWLLTLEEPGE